MKSPLEHIAVDYMINAPCNLKCPFCYGPPPNMKGELNINDKKELIGGLARGGIKKVVLGGGEPLLSNEIGEIVTTLYDKKIGIGIQTNGFFYSKTEKLFKYIDWIAYPFDGISIESQMKMRTSDRHFDTFIESITLTQEYLKKDNHNSLRIKVGTVASQFNIDEIEEMGAIVHKYKVDVWKIYKIRSRGKGVDFCQNAISDDTIWEKINDIQARFPELNIYYSSDGVSKDSYIIIDPDSSTYVVNGFEKKIFGRLVSNGIFDDELWQDIIDYTDIKAMENNINHSFPNWI